MFFADISRTCSFNSKIKISVEPRYEYWFFVLETISQSTPRLSLFCKNIVQKHKEYKTEFYTLIKSINFGLDMRLLLQVLRMSNEKIQLIIDWADLAQPVRSISSRINLIEILIYVVLNLTHQQWWQNFTIGTLKRNCDVKIFIERINSWRCTGASSRDGKCWNIKYSSFKRHKFVTFYDRSAISFVLRFIVRFLPLNTTRYRALWVRQIIFEEQNIEKKILKISELFNI